MADTGWSPVVERLRGHDWRTHSAIDNALRDEAAGLIEELYEALEYFAHEFDQTYDGPESPYPNGIVEAATRARAALSRARGES